MIEPVEFRARNAANFLKLSCLAREILGKISISTNIKFNFIRIFIYDDLHHQFKQNEVSAFQSRRCFDFTKRANLSPMVSEKNNVKGKL